MPQEIRPRRLKMKARRRSPFMLALSVVTAWMAAPGAAAGRTADPRGERTATTAPDTSAARRIGEVGWEDAYPETWWPAPETPKPVPRYMMLWQTGYQRFRVAGGSRVHLESHQLSHDLGLLVRGGDGHHWGGAATVFWQGNHREMLAFKGIRRWTLDPVSDVYLQLAPGAIVAGRDKYADLTPGFMLELELGNRWVALTTGMQAIGWRTEGGAFDVAEEKGTDVITYLGIRTHGILGVGLYALLLVALAVAVSRGGWS